MSLFPDFQRFDSLRTPLVITDKDGLVIYRNKTFSSHFRKPRRGGNIFKHIGERTSLDDIFPYGLPAYSAIEKVSGSGLDIVRTSWRAFVYICENPMTDIKIKEFLVWLFPRRVITASHGQAISLLPFYSDRLGTLKSILWEFYKSPNPRQQHLLPYSRSPESVFDSISDGKVLGLRQGNANEFPIDLASFFGVFSDYIIKQLGIRGFRFEANYSSLKVGDTLTIAGYELAALCVQLIYAALILSEGHKLLMECFYSDSKLSIKFTAPLPEGNTGITSSGSLYDAAFHNLSLSTELFFCDLLWNAPGRRVIWESWPDKVVLRAECALESPNFVKLRTTDSLTLDAFIDKLAEFLTIMDE